MFDMNQLCLTTRMNLPRRGRKVTSDGGAASRQHDDVCQYTVRLGTFGHERKSRMTSLRYTRLALTVPAVCCMLLLNPGFAKASDYYKYEIIARSTPYISTLLDIFPNVSVNNNGLVAFTTRPSSGVGTSLFVGDERSITEVFPSAYTFGPPQINDRNQILAAQVLGSLGRVLLQSFTLGSSPKLIQTSDSTAIFNYSSIFPEVSINNVSTPGLSSVVFTGVVGRNELVLSTPSPIPEIVSPNRRPIGLPASPVIADDGSVVVRDGNQTTSPIVVFNNDLKSVRREVATSADFSRLGQRPGIDDGQVVVFYGDLINNAFGTTAGPGIFAAIDTSSGWVIQRIAGVAGNGVLDPGETFIDANLNGIFDSGIDVEVGPNIFNPDDRVGVNATQQPQVFGAGVATQPAQRAVTVTYVGFDSITGKKMLYSSRLNFFISPTGAPTPPPFDPRGANLFTVSTAAPVARVGENLGVFFDFAGQPVSVQDLSVYDPVNSRDRGDVAFRVVLDDGTRAVVRARPQQVVFLDFDPINNYVPTALSQSLFKAAGVNKPGWQGNLDTFLSLEAFNRPEFIGAVNAIQDSIVATVQNAFDDLSPGSGLSVNVKVLGRVRELAPTEGPFIRVYVGDSPNTDANPNGVAGIAPLDLFNQERSDNNPSIAGYLQRTPLIFIDNFRRDFVDASGNVVRLKDVGNPVDPLSKITVDEFVNAVGTTIAHEVGHALGLRHLDDTKNNLIMNRRRNFNEVRSRRVFGNSLVQLQDSDLFDTHPQPSLFLGVQGSENSGARLALSVGSDADLSVLSRNAPNPNVQKSNNRFAYSLAATTLNNARSVVRAAIGVVPLGQEDAEPELIDLGAGDLATLLRRDINVSFGDQIFVVASTTGNGIDIFGVAQGFTGNVRDIDLTSQLLVLTDGRIRANLFDAAGQPVPVALSLYQLTDSGPVQIGTVGAAVNNPTAADVTAQVNVARGGLRFDRATGRFVQAVTLTNTGTNAIAGPVSLVLDNLGAGVTLANGTGTTATVVPTGSPYINVGTGGLGAGKTATVRLEFASLVNTGVGYNTRVLAGPGTR